MKLSIQERLRAEAHRLNKAWGKSPSADLMREAANALDQATQPSTTIKKPRKDTN